MCGACLGLSGDLSRGLLARPKAILPPISFQNFHFNRAFSVQGHTRLPSSSLPYDTLCHRLLETLSKALLLAEPQSSHWPREWVRPGGLQAPVLLCHSRVFHSLILHPIFTKLYSVPGPCKALRTVGWKSQTRSYLTSSRHCAGHTRHSSCSQPLRLREGRSFPKAHQPQNYDTPT